MLLTTGKLAITGTGGAVDYVAPGITDLMLSLATKEMLHNISNAVCFLAMNSNTSDGWIYVNATEKNTLWADTVRSATYNFLPGNSPGAEFIRKIGPCLKDTPPALSLPPPPITVCVKSKISGGMRCHNRSG